MFGDNNIAVKYIGVHTMTCRTCQQCRWLPHLVLLALGDPGSDRARGGALLGVGVHQRLEHVLEGRRVVRQEQLALPQVVERLAACTFRTMSVALGPLFVLNRQSQQTSAADDAVANSTVHMKSWCGLPP